MTSKRPVRRDTAARVMTRAQRLFLEAVLLGLVAQAYVFGYHSVIVTLVVGCEIFYFVFVVFKLVLATASYLPTLTVLRPAPAKTHLPSFTILLPMAKEKLSVLRAQLDSIRDLDYPQDLIQIVPCIDYDDIALQRMFGLVPGGPGETLDLPRNVTPALRLEGTPATKPAAMAFGLAIATGELTVIYDAEDSPSRNQLDEAARAFARAGPDVACLQARLTFWNILPGLKGTRRSWMASLIPRLYYVEYAVHFEFVLKGMARLGLIPPLGGTSNVFVTEKLREIRVPTSELVSGGIPESVATQMVAAWDPWNVAEDADIAAWLARFGYKIQMVAGVWTVEEAPVSPGKAQTQRSRWGKGYGQTGLVQLRHPLQATRDMGFWQYFCFELMTLGTPLSLMINPVFWALTIIYFTTHSTFIQSLFPAPILYVGLFTGVVGNFLLFYLHITACLRDREHGLVKSMFALGPFWVMTSLAMWSGILELAIPKLRHRWRLSSHGHYSAALAKAAVEKRHSLMSGRT
jgi:cellulose synthase/poly-beta-1,6-N-acetylglucosamine synthase-like glycosyltransferase